MEPPALIRIGTRGSLLALAQSHLVAASIEHACPPCRAELVPITTRGDRWAGPLDAAGGKGLFTAELEAALREGRVQLAVHSAKDLPAEMPADLVLAGVPLREDPRDAMVTRGGASLADLPPGAAVGTGSLRRAAQLKALRPDLKIVPIRGNVETRLRKVLEPAEKSGQLQFSAAENCNCPDFSLDAVVLAMAGLKRSGLLPSHKDRIRPLTVEECIPAAGQGALALQCAAADASARAVAARITDAASLEALLAEREVVRALGADCHSCLAVHVRSGDATPFPAAGNRVVSPVWHALAMAARPDGGGLVCCEARGASASAAGEALLEDLRRRGAPGLLRA